MGIVREGETSNGYLPIRKTVCGLIWKLERGRWRKRMKEKKMPSITVDRRGVITSFHRGEGEGKRGKINEVAKKKKRTRTSLDPAKTKSSISESSTGKKKRERKKNTSNKGRKKRREKTGKGLTTFRPRGAFPPLPMEGKEKRRMVHVKWEKK